MTKFNPIQIPKRVTLVCDGPGKNQTSPLHAHDTVLSLLAFLGLALDGTYQVLKPNGGDAYPMDAPIYPDFNTGDTVRFVRHPDAGPYGGTMLPSGMTISGGRRK